MWFFHIPDQTYPLPPWYISDTFIFFPFTHIEPVTAIHLRVKKQNKVVMYGSENRLISLDYSNVTTVGQNGNKFTATCVWLGTFANPYR